MVAKKGKRAILTNPFFLDLLALQIYQHFSRNPFVKHFSSQAHSMQEVLDEFPEERVRLREPRWRNGSTGLKSIESLEI